MRLETERCLACRNRERRHEMRLFADTWFCSEACSQKEVGKYPDARFHWNKELSDDPEWNELVERLHHEYNSSFKSDFWLVLTRLIHNVGNVGKTTHAALRHPLNGPNSTSKKHGLRKLFTDYTVRII